MRVAVYYNNRDVRIQEQPQPKIGPGELLIRVEASGICGSDVLEWYRRDKTPLILGHEIAGVIEQLGQGLTKYKLGQRVCASHHVPCGKCSFCLRGHQTVCPTLRQTHFDPGGFVEYLRLPAINVELGGVYPLPDNLSYEEATFIEPLACVLRGQRFLGEISQRSVLVMGCGISGLLHLALAKLKGVSLIVACDVVDSRLAYAKNLGADAVINVQKEDLIQRVHQLNQGQGVDLVVVATGSKTANTQALAVVGRGGSVLFFAATPEGVEIPVSINNLFWRNEVTLVSSYAATPAEHLEALDLISRQQIVVRHLISHRFGLDDVQQGFSLVAEAGNSLKVIIFPFLKKNA